MRDFKKVLECKEIDRSFNDLKPHTQESRFMMSFCLHSMTMFKNQMDQTEEDVVKGLQITATTFMTKGMNLVLPSGVLWDKMFIILASGKSFIDQDSEPQDSTLLTNSKLPPWMELDHIYIFKYETDRDTSEFAEKINVGEILSIQPIETKKADVAAKYCVRIDLKDRFHMFGMELASECNSWMRALRRAKKTHEETLRSQDQKLRKNVDLLIHQYKFGSVNDILGYCYEEFELYTMGIDVKRTKPQVFIKAMMYAQFGAFDTLDAIQACRPFHQHLFKLVMETFHRSWTALLTKYYNSRFRDIDGLTILQFADLTLKQLKGNKKYGMTDRRYEDCVNDLLSTFFSRTFKNMMPLVIEICYRIQKDYSKDNEVCESFGPVDLFKFMNEVYDLSFACYDPIVQKGVLNLIFK